VVVGGTVAVNQSRSQNAELAEGMSDGKYKKVVVDRSNAELTFWKDRADLNDTYYGIHEAREKALPDGTIHVTPSFVTTPAAHLP
jgi:hypothetical protein